MAIHLTGMVVPAPGMSRYQFTDENGYVVGSAEARTGAEAHAAVVSRTGYTGRLHSTHLADGPAVYTRPAFLDTPSSDFADEEFEMHLANIA